MTTGREIVASALAMGAGVGMPLLSFGGSRSRPRPRPNVTRWSDTPEMRTKLARRAERTKRQREGLVR